MSSKHFDSIWRGILIWCPPNRLVSLASGSNIFGLLPHHFAKCLGLVPLQVVCVQHLVEDGDGCTRLECRENGDREGSRAVAAHSKMRPASDHHPSLGCHQRSSVDQVRNTRMRSVQRVNQLLTVAHVLVNHAVAKRAQFGPVSA